MVGKNRIAYFACVISLCFFVLEGCGGGGGAKSSAKPDFSVTFSPEKLSADLLETGTTTWSVQVTVKGTVDGDVVPVMVDKAGIIKPGFYFEQLSSTQYKATFQVVNNLAVGNYIDDIKLRLCSSQSCSKEYSGSPWSLPYSVTVKSHNNLVNLTQIPNYTGWGSRFGNSNKDGYVPVTLDSSQFSYRWFKRFPPGESISDVVTEDDKVFFYTTKEVNQGPFSITALDQWDGNTLWQKLYDTKPENGSSNRAFGLNVADNLVSFVRFSPPNGDTYFTALNSLSGQVEVEHMLWEFAYGGSGAILDKNNFYMYGSFQLNYRFASLTRSDGSFNWMLPYTDYENLIYVERWLPTIDNQYVYIFNQSTCNPIQYCDPAGLHVYDKQSGNETSFIADPNPEEVFRGELMPPILTNQGVLALNGRVTDIFSAYINTTLSLYDVEAKAVKWSHSAPYIYQPVVANGVVYTVLASTELQKLTVEARNLTTGELLWQFPIAAKNQFFTAIRDSMIITNNVLLIGTTESVIALDINTKKMVWEYPFGGSIALTQSGVLIVSRHPNSNYSPGDSYVISAITLR